MSPYTRREFAKFALTALPAIGALPVLSRLSAAEPMKAAGKPNSKVAGVQIGLNVPYSFGNNAMNGDDVLKNCVQLGVSALELRSQPVELFLGVAPDLISPRRAAAMGEGASKAAPADPAAAQAAAESLRQWRSKAPLGRVKEFRKQYEDAGVAIEILKVDGIYALTDDTLDYFFAMAKALGARAISCEISTKEEDLKRVGRFADKHRLWVGYHGHATTTPEHWEQAFSYAKYNAANVDLGHFVAGNNASPVEFIKKHHERITHVHVKDRKKQNGPNTPFGEGDTPIVEVLRLIRDNHWKMQATIEFEYPVPAGSNRMAEIARAVKYCRDALA
jgi:sugar phosphate isomerase/epimerase